MILEREFLNKLKDFGLNSYEAKLWTALLSRGVATAGELSDIANVPRSRSYDVLESLERKGFIILKIGKPIKYIAVPPQEVIDRVKRNIHEEAEKHTGILNNLKKSDLINELTKLQKKGIEGIEPTEIAGVVRGRKNIYHHLQSMIKNAEKSIVFMTTEQGILRKIDFLYPLLKKAQLKQVKIKIALPVTKQTKDIIKNLKEYAEVRNIENIKTRCCIVDNKSITFLANDEFQENPMNDFGIWLDVLSVTKNIETIILSSWDHMKPI